MHLDNYENWTFHRLAVKSSVHVLHWYVHGNVNNMNMFEHGYLNVDSFLFQHLGRSHISQAVKYLKVSLNVLGFLGMYHS